MKYFCVIILIKTLITMLPVKALPQNFYVTDFSLKQAKNLAIPVEIEEFPEYEISQKVYLKKLISYFRNNYALPECLDSGNKEKDIEDFNFRLKIWYQNYPEFVDVLNLRTFYDFYKFDAGCYDKPPVYKQGLSKSDEDAYEKRFNNWTAHHPDLPKIMGDDEEAKIKYEKELMNFLNKYYKR